MAFLIANLPPTECFIRKEFLYDFEPDKSNPYGLKGAGEYTPCIWISIKSLQGRAFYIESLVTEYGGLYDKLPLHAYVWNTQIQYTQLLDLEMLQLWDCFSYEMSVLRKQALSGLKVKYKAKDNNWYFGNYMFTVDNVVSDPNVLDVSYVQEPSEHKSFNFIRLDNGQFAAQPNNRIIWFEPSHSPSKLKKPDFKVSTKVWSVEDKPKWRFGDTDQYFYEISESQDE